MEIIIVSKSQRTEIVRCCEQVVLCVGGVLPPVAGQTREVARKLRVYKANIESMAAEINAVKALMELCKKLEWLGAFNEAEAIERLARSIFFSDSVSARV